VAVGFNSRVALPLIALFCWQLALPASASADSAKPDLKPGANLLANPDFALGRQFWNLGKAKKTVATLDINGDDTPAGDQSAILSVGEIDSWGVQFGQDIDGGKVGKTYTFAVFAEAVGGPAKVSLQIERRADPYDRATHSEEVALPAKWRELHTTFTVEKPFSEGWSAYVSCTQPNVKFRVMHFRLHEGEYTPWKEDAGEAAAEQTANQTTVAGVAVFDLPAHIDQPLTAEALGKRDGWTRIAKEDGAHAFTGDAVLMNSRMAMVFRANGPGAEVYSIEPQRIVKRSVIAPAAGDGLLLAGVKILQNGSSSGTIEASFKAADGKMLTMGYALRRGQPFVQVMPGETSGAVRVVSQSRFAVMPDFFADDIVVDARALPPDNAELPSDSFLMNLLGDGEAVQMAVWTNRQEEASVGLSGKGAERHIDYTDIPCGKGEKVWIALLSAPGIWHEQDISRSDAGHIVTMDWKPPMPAIWRVDWRKDDQLADSWEMLNERSDGKFTKQRLVGSIDTLPADRKRWNTVLGTFSYPCWIGNDGTASLQPLKSHVLHFDGPAVIYPLGRVGTTPLDQFSVVDIVRATLGVGPCEYILDLEGQQGQYKGRATCANRDTLNPIYEKGEQTARKQEVETSLSDVVIFIRHIRSRIEIYRAFGHDMSSYLAQQKQTHPELAEPLDQLDALAKVIDTRIAARAGKIKTPDEAAAMVEAYRQGDMNDTGPDAFDKCKAFTESIVEIGDNQDELSGECRLAVKILRQRAGMLQATDPRLAEVVKEIRTRTQAVLRNPANHESAGH
jgi:hypothetical protein